MIPLRLRHPSLRYIIDAFDLSDIINNVLLYLPLGIALGGSSLKRALLFGLCLSTCAETLQLGFVDSGGRVRGWDVNQDRYGIAEVSSFDVARSGGHAVYALAGWDEDGRPIVAKSGSAGALVACLGAAADEVVVVRPLSAAQAPAEILVSTDGHIERVGT